MTRMSLPTWTMALSGTLLTACGARTGLLIGDGALEDQADGAPHQAQADGGALQGEAAACAGGKDISLEMDAPNIYFVLDHSSSMKQMSKWPNIREAVANLMDQLGPNARFDTWMFPAPATPDACAPGAEVMPLRLGDRGGVTSRAFLSATTMNPSGGTPTGATLEALLPKVTGLRDPAFVILATDGGPNCNPSLSCSVDTCTVNIDGALTDCPLGGPVNCCDPSDPSHTGPLGCLDGSRTEQAVADLAAAGVETFVMGIPGSAPYAAVLDDLATAGKTGRPNEPRYYRVDSADTTALGEVFAQIAAQTSTGCTFTLARPPADAGTLDVYVNGALVTRDAPDGWSLAGLTLTLGGAACDAARAAGAASVQAVDGC